MATTFFINTKKDAGFASLFVRLQSRKLKINYKAASPIEVDIQKWNNSLKGDTQLRNYRRSNPELFKMLDSIQKSLDSILFNETKISLEEFKKVIYDIAFEEERVKARKSEEERKAAEAAANRMTLNKFIDLYVQEISSGERQTSKGMNFKPGTVRAVKQPLEKFKQFQEEAGREIDFEDVDLEFYKQFGNFLKKENYAANSIAKCFKQIKTVMGVAESEGYHTNVKYKDKRFKSSMQDIDSIYLTMEDLYAMQSIDFSQLQPCYEQAMDIFMIGVWSAQRVSDYNRISESNVKRIRTQVIENNKIVDRELVYLDIVQKKTGAKVSIPCNAALRGILEKYNYQLPHIWEQHLNDYIKKIGELAGLTNFVDITSTKGGKVEVIKVPKYKLIHTHTARRTGATLMYLAGVDIYDIMKITGHASPAMLKKYIKADSLEVATKISAKYDYFR